MPESLEERVEELEKKVAELSAEVSGLLSRKKRNKLPVPMLKVARMIERHLQGIPGQEGVTDDRALGRTQWFLPSHET